MKIKTIIYVAVLTAALQLAYAVSYDDYVLASQLRDEAIKSADALNYLETIKLALTSLEKDPDNERNRLSLMLLATSYSKIGDFQKSRQWQQNVIDSYRDKMDPRLYDAYISMGKCLTRLNNFSGAVEYYKMAMSIHADANAKNNLAWIIASAPVLDSRDNSLSVTLAKEAVEDTKWNEPNYLDTYATALASDGQFEKAIEVQNKAVLLIGKDNAFSYLVKIKLFEIKVPYRLDVTIEKALELLANEKNKM